MKSATLVIYKSADCEKWEPVLPADIPDWLKDPDIVGHMVRGEACQNNGSDWFTAKRVLTESDESAMTAAEAKRVRRRQRNIALNGTAH